MLVSLPEVRECNTGRGGTEKDDSNLSEQGSGLLLSCRLAHFNCSQAFTRTEDGFFCVCIYGCECVSVGVCVCVCGGGVREPFLPF